MITSEVKPGEQVKQVSFAEDTLSVDLLDGRTITVPLAWYPRLLHATLEQRLNWEVSGAGYGLHWPDIDEDLSVEGMLRGTPAPDAALEAAYAEMAADKDNEAEALEWAEGTIGDVQDD